MLEAEVFETLVYVCVTSSPNKTDYDRIRHVNHFMHLRCLGRRKHKRDDHTLSFANAYAKTDSEDSEVIVFETEDIIRGIRAESGKGAPAAEGDVCVAD